MKKHEIKQDSEDCRNRSSCDSCDLYAMDSRRIGMLPRLKCLIIETVKFLLFQEDNPKHRVIHDLSPWHVLIAFLALPLAFWGMTIWGELGFLGFLGYYVVVALVLLEIVHVLCAR